MCGPVWGIFRWSIRGKWVLLAVSHIAGEVGYSLISSPFPPCTNHRLIKICHGAKLCYFGEKTMQVKSSCFSYWLQCIQKYIKIYKYFSFSLFSFFLLFLGGGVLELPLATWTSLSNDSLVHGSHIRQLSRGAWTTAKKAWSWFTRHCRFQSQDQDSFITWSMDEWDSPWVPWCKKSII